MRPKRLIWQLYPSILLIVVVSLLAVGTYTSRSLRAFYVDEIAKDLEARASLVMQLVVPDIEAGRRTQIDSLAKRLGRLTATRITIIRADGTVLGDTDEDPAVMDDHSTRPEVKEALAGKVGSSTRFSKTVRKNMMYVAMPVQAQGGRVRAIVRTSLPLTSIESALTRVYIQMAIGGLIISVLAAAITLFISRRISRPLEDLETAARRFAAGDLSLRLRATGSDEVASLAGAMNQMAAQLQDRIRAVVEQRNEREAVLGSMVEAVIAVDSDERVITLNTAAARMLSADAPTALGRSIQEVARNPELQEFISTALASDSTQEGDLTLHGQDSRFLQAHGGPIRNASGTHIGAVIVLNDVTRLRRLEAMRREFVANVSHELKTPITSIKGFLETLSDGALDDPANARRFIDIAARQADRLNAIIEDLLSLSRIEQDSEYGAVPVTRERLRPALLGALEVCTNKAEEKQIAIHLECSESLEAEFNAPLIEQAIINLVDNAIKYSEEGGSVEVLATADSSTTIISVRDHGCGIETVHFPRLFERFYRVDKARSRSLGGTGLGLAIVKHIAQAHNGSVGVDSAPGKGSTFTLRLPRSAPAPAAPFGSSAKKGALTGT